MFYRACQDLWGLLALQERMVTKVTLDQQEKKAQRGARASKDLLDHLDLLDFQVKRGISGPSVKRVPLDKRVNEGQREKMGQEDL